jgi:hypothetical protein
MLVPSPSRLAGIPLRVAARGGLVALLAAVLLLAGRSAASAQAAQEVLLPFAGGQSVRVVQGYEGGSHQGRSRFGLDLVLAGGATSGAPVLAPVSGSVAWSFPPGTGNGCMAIAMPERSHSVALCHVLFDRPFRYGEAVARGQRLGVVGAAGSVGNNGLPHVHLELHRGGGGSSPVPFSAPDGLPLDGVDLSAGVAHAGRAPLVSHNAAAGPAASAADSPPATPTARAAPPPPTATPTPPPAAPPTPAPTPPPSQEPTPAATPARAAVVVGTESCLRVREEPDVGAAMLGCLPDGAEVALAPSADGPVAEGWRKLAEGGWVAREYLRLTRAVVVGTGAGGCLNVREQPARWALVLACLAEGTGVAVVEGPTRDDADAEWLRVGKSVVVDAEGWVSGAFLD